MTGKSREASLPRSLMVGLGVVMAATSLLYLFTAYYGQFETITQRGILIGVSLFIVFLLNPLTKTGGRWVLALDFLLALLAAAIISYLVYLEQTETFSKSGAISPLRQIIAWVLVILVLEGTRRAVGWPLPILAAFFIIYGRFGASFPGVLWHPGMRWDLMAKSLVFTINGIFGTAAHVAATVIIIFMIFGAFLKATESRFFLDIPIRLFGKVRGGPAKIDVVGSSIFGIVTGSTAANVAAVGTFTIPLMKQLGYSGVEAAAIESLTSSGAMVSPPVMGIVAFVMAELLGITYWEVCVAAFLPSVLWYLGLYFGIDFKAVKRGMKGSSSLEMPTWGKAISSAAFLLPVALLVYLLGVLQWSPMKAGLLTIGAMIVISLFYPSNRLGPRRLYKGLIEGTKSAIMVTCVCACAGIIIGVILSTGIGVKLSQVLIELSHGNMFVLLVLSAMVNIVLGMGMPALPAYLFLVFLVAPALSGMGMLPLQAHMFIFFYAALSSFTPPVAVAAYVAAAVAGEDPNKVGLKACQMGAILFILPFIFAYDARLLLLGSPGEVIQAFVTACLGVLFFVSAMEGITYWIGKLAAWQRVVFAIAGILLVIPGTLSDLVGFVLVGGVILSWLILRRSHARLAKQP